MPQPLEAGVKKATLRVLARQRLARLGVEERRARSETLVARLIALPAWQAARRVLLFAPVPAEPDLDLLWTTGGLEGKECAYPRVAGSGLDLLRVRSPTDLQPGRWGLREPSAEGSAGMALGEFELVLVPGLAFDKNGGRLGRGGGFYDRLLAEKCGATLTLGAAFAFQIVSAVPLEPRDAVMDMVITD